jgi:hypothetical protein
MGKFCIVLIFFLMSRVDSWAISPANNQLDKYPHLSTLVNRYNAIDKFNKNLLAKRVQILVKISNMAAALYKKNPQDLTLGEIHEAYLKEAQELFAILNSQKNNMAKEAKFSSHSRRLLKPRQSNSRRMKISPLTPFGKTLSDNERNFKQLPELTNQMDLSSLMADKAMASLHRITPLEQNIQDFRGSSLSFSPPSRDMDTPYMPQAPRRLARQPLKQDTIE